jgi:hypothetical protein
MPPLPPFPPFPTRLPRILRICLGRTAELENNLLDNQSSISALVYGLLTASLASASRNILATAHRSTSSAPPGAIIIAR